MIALFYNAFRNPNGTITITNHLALMFRALGEEVHIYRMVKNPGKSKPLCTAGGHIAREITIEEGVSIVENNPALMVHYMHDGSELQDYAVELVRRTALPLIIHDYRGLKPEMLEAVKSSNARIVFIRDPLRMKFLKDSDGKYDVIFLRHPYIRHEDVDCKVRYNAVSVGRIAREKKIEMVCAANILLPKRKKIMIAGAETDRIYSHFTLDKFFPDWKDYRIKEPGTDQFSLCRSSKFSVDMTEFKGEGGGTQYTFLEAMDAGSQLVLNSNWIVSGNSEMVPGHNCVVAKDPVELSNIVSNEPIALDGYEDTLWYHSVDAVGESWLRVCYER